MAASNMTFKNVAEDFVLSVNYVSPQHKHLVSSCRSPGDLLDQITKLEFLQKARRREAQYIGPIRRIIERLDPYFKAIDVLVQCDPIHAASVWGSLRVVIQLASNFSTFFEKLMKCLDQLASAFPVYERMEKLFESRPPGLQASLKHLYTDLFRFLSEILRVFCRPKGGIPTFPPTIAHHW
ncbi:hypothetical protein BDV06DRAFT_200740 [Aspergillus oleicola]